MIPLSRMSSLALAFFLAAASVGAEEGFVPVFNGKDLQGWDGDPRFWTVRDGVIRGETTLQALPTGNTFLIWRGGVLKDFELKLQVRIQNGNSGVQYRSRDEGKWVVSGYQAEVENKPGKSGFLYEELGRKHLAQVGETVEVQADGKPRVVGGLMRRATLVLQGYYRAREWNEYRIVARGNRLEHWVNGVQTVEVTDQDPARRALAGLLALQLHSGPPMLVEFKELQIKNLAGSEQAGVARPGSGGGVRTPGAREEEGAPARRRLTRVQPWRAAGRSGESGVWEIAWPARTNPWHQGLCSAIFSACAGPAVRHFPTPNQPHFL